MIDHMIHFDFCFFFCILFIKMLGRVMKKALEDTSDLLRKKRNLPGSALGVWNLNNSVRKEQVFYDPLMTGELVILFPDFLFCLSSRLRNLVL